MDKREHKRLAVVYAERHVGLINQVMDDVKKLDNEEGDFLRALDVHRMQMERVLDKLEREFAAIPAPRAKPKKLKGGE